MWCIIQDLGKGKATVHKKSKEWKSLFQGKKNNIICFHSSPKMNKPKNFNVLPERARRDYWDGQGLNSCGRSDWVSYRKQRENRNLRRKKEKVHMIWEIWIGLQCVRSFRDLACPLSLWDRHAFLISKNMKDCVTNPTDIYVSQVIE